MLHKRNLARLVCCKTTKMNISTRPKNNLVNIYDVADRHSINTALELLNQGEVIALPTDTVYGLACNANNPKAVEKLYKIKNRNENKPVAICVADFKNLKFYGNAEHLSDKILENLLPGAITIVLDKTKNLKNPHLNPGVLQIGIRIPKYAFIQDLCKKLNYPLALTSANVSSEKSSLNINEFEKIWSNLGGVFDGGTIGFTEECRNASTVIDLSCPNCYKILREGISFEKTINIMKIFNFNSI